MRTTNPTSWLSSSRLNTEIVIELFSQSAYSKVVKSQITQKNRQQIGKMFDWEGAVAQAFRAPIFASSITEQYAIPWIIGLWIMRKKGWKYFHETFFLIRTLIFLKNYKKIILQCQGHRWEFCTCKKSLRNWIHTERNRRDRIRRKKTGLKILWYSTYCSFILKENKLTNYHNH